MTAPETPPEQRAARAPLAFRIRGSKDETVALEQRLKDLETITRTLGRRWWLVGLGLAIGLAGRAFDLARPHPGTMVLIAGAALILNALLGIISERGWYRWWLIYALALLDVVLAAVPVVWFGHGGFVVAFLIAVLPYTFDPGRTVGDLLVLAAALAYLGATQLHRVLYGGEPAFSPAPVLETVILVDGEVSARPSEMRNPEMGTGDVEVRVQNFTVVGPAETPAIPVAIQNAFGQLSGTR